MSQTEPAVQPASISEIEFAVRLNYGIRTMLNYRKAGKLPQHFLVKTCGPHPQVRYLLTVVDEFEKTLTKSKQ